MEAWSSLPQNNQAFLPVATRRGAGSRSEWFGTNATWRPPLARSPCAWDVRVRGGATLDNRAGEREDMAP